MSITTIKCGDKTVECDDDNGAVYVWVSKGASCEQSIVSENPLIILDKDEKGNIVGVEIY